MTDTEISVCKHPTMNEQMDYPEKTFEWQQFPEGKVQFLGGIRGWDKRGYCTFAVELEGEVVYGEIARVFLPDQNGYTSKWCLGYGMRENVGILNEDGTLSNAKGIFSSAYVQRVQSLGCAIDPGRLGHGKATLDRQRIC